ncbi:C40 family peptidase [Alicyclobacillus sp. SO9]|uniref:C40 family peptidase n=1 Tax=Alicyclobacillus sp. SO9 TaxID=2665646 RepID=UPI0018E748DC|nr:C40 family peptidase [Alicyclobacillus sp. SO9]QQE76843.1 C40 family peptidase [Alicyclobacillus sp. SO9]
MSRVLRVTSTVLVAVSTAPLPSHELQTQPAYSQGRQEKSTNSRQRLALQRRYLLQKVPVATKTSIIYALSDNRMVRMSQSQTLVAEPHKKSKPANKAKVTVTKSGSTTKKHSDKDSQPQPSVKPLAVHKPVSRGTSFESLTRSHSNEGVRIAKYALTFVGKPYRWGGESPAGFDCSGLVQYVYRHYHIGLPRTSYAQFKVGRWVAESHLHPGDLVFFSTDNGGASHVAIYVGNGLIVQSLNPSTGVIVSHLDNPYYRSRFVGARRPW